MNDETVSVVSYATGVCTFTIPDEYEIFFNYISNNEFDIQYYYARVSGNQYTNNIRNAGRTLSIPARILFNLVSQVHQVHLQEPASSSSSGFEKRDEIDDFLDSVSDTDGTPVDINLSAVAADDESSVSESGTESVTDVESESVTTGTDDADTEATATDDNNTEATGADDNNTEATGADDETTNKGTVAGTTHKDTSTVTGTEIVTVTSCKNDACHVTTVPGTETTVTTTVNGVETIYTTYCPVSSIETVQESKTITVIACKEDKCHETTAVAVPSTVQEVVEQTTTVYITYKPVSTPADETIATNVVTSGSGIYVPVPTAITSGETVVESTVYVTVTKISDTHPSTIGAPLPPATIAENPEPVTLISEGTTIHTTAVGEGISPGSTVYTILTGETSVSQQVPSETIASISTFTGGAASRSVSSLLGMLLIPILYLI
ncbi:Yeast-form wall Protein 1 [Candida tropicalis]